MLLSLQVGLARADEEESGTGERILGGVLSGLLGGPQPAPGAAYTAQEKERLVSLLESGEYVTSRQGEPVDLMVFGVPLTHIDHVYTARPIPPSQTVPRQERR
jgi:hypothetical protein